MKKLLLKLIVTLNLVWVYCLPLRESSEDLNENKALEYVKFYLYTKSNFNFAQELFINDEESVRNSNFDKTLQTRILIHGWGGSYLTAPNTQLREAYFSQENYNIVSVDWHQYAKLNYLSARAKVPVVGETVASLIDFLQRKFHLNIETLVIIGHSLGAHVAGFCGKNIKNYILPAIVGLDPAMPLYSYDKPDSRLSEIDASYVQTIQTNGNVKGFLHPIGSAAFYPNWGRVQPGCGSDLDGTCSHGRCIFLYAEAIRGFSFAPIQKCESFENIKKKEKCDEMEAIVQMGDPLNIVRTNGIFYLSTNSENPYGHLTERL